MGANLGHVIGRVPVTIAPVPSPASHYPVRVWLLAIAGLIFVMTMVGGATRLTESGLSITQWKPISGMIPPLNDADWRAEFDGYKQIPQFKLVHSDMDLAAFKSIFWWEWAHRLLARIIGAVFIIPALWFWLRGALKGAVGQWTLLATGFLALEPIVGWWMVASGLSERVEVAPQRLAAHLLIAAATYGAALVGAASLSGQNDGRRSTSAALLAGLIYMQLGLGALAAGLRAGLLDNTWPFMEGRWIPASVFPGADPFAAMIADPATAQFDHRLVAYAVVLLASALALVAKTRGAILVAALAWGQAALGVTTLLFVVPVPLGLAHQALALALFGAAIWHWRTSVAA